MYIKAVILALSIFLAACLHSSPPASAGGKPQWVDNPPYGAVGMASGYFIDGENAKIADAMHKAINLIAMQKEVSVSSEHQYNQTGNPDYVSSNSSTKSVQTISNVKVSTKLKEVWKDPQTNNIYVWVAEE